MIIIPNAAELLLRPSILHMLTWINEQEASVKDFLFLYACLLTPFLASGACSHVHGVVDSKKSQTSLSNESTHWKKYKRLRRIDGELVKPRLTRSASFSLLSLFLLFSFLSRRISCFGFIDDRSI
ncbi:hypothetical protein M5K25_022771 [Dendrobium thyrsiflorum]|uniref:Uncharacterized protein n=1 Tax=Dendrobium thyrsiflorum TaxID=117978 RepID=A0ABD0U6S8_DENTH